MTGHTLGAFLILAPSISAALPVHRSYLPAGRASIKRTLLKRLSTNTVSPEEANLNSIITGSRSYSIGLARIDNCKRREVASRQAQRI